MSVRLQVRVHPGSHHPGLVSRMADGSLKLAVAEAPEGGKANRAVEALVAGLLSLERARVRVVAGAAARRKVVEIEDADAREVERRIAAALARRERAGGAGRGTREVDDGQ